MLDVAKRCLAPGGIAALMRSAAPFALLFPATCFKPMALTTCFKQMAPDHVLQANGP